MNIQHCFFDLDGTLTDSSRGITNSVAYALKKCGITPPPREELLCFIGPPLVRAFSEFYGMSSEEASRAVAFYREYYPVHGIFECDVYAGVRELLEELHRHKIPCTLATCKPHVFACRILEHFDLSKYFSFVSGPELDGTRNEKQEVIAHALQTHGITDPSSVLMIGDRRDDILGARALGVCAVGAEWGFGTREELEAAGANAVLHSPGAIAKWLFPPKKNL